MVSGHQVEVWLFSCEVKLRVASNYQRLSVLEMKKFELCLLGAHNYRGFSLLDSLEAEDEDV